MEEIIGMGLMGRRRMMRFKVLGIILILELGVMILELEDGLLWILLLHRIPK